MHRKRGGKRGWEIACYREMNIRTVVGALYEKARDLTYGGNKQVVLDMKRYKTDNF